MKTQYIYVNSADRTSGAINNFRVKLRETMTYVQSLTLSNVNMDVGAFAGDVFIQINQLENRNIGTTDTLHYTFMLAHLNHSGSLINFEETDYKQVIGKLPDVDISDFTIRVVDKDNNPITLATDWSLLFKIERI